MTEQTEIPWAEDSPEAEEAAKLAALLDFLGVELEEGETAEDYITAETYGDQTQYEFGNQTYLVLTDSEADEAAAEYIKTSLWAFNASFLAEQTELPEEVFSSLQESRSEDANETFLTLVEKCGDLEEFVSAAIGADGRGHFLAQYDGNENEAGDSLQFYIYRTN